MERSIIQGMEDPVRIRGFLLTHFYLLVGVVILCCLFIISSISNCIEQGSIMPILENLILSCVVVVTLTFILRRLSVEPTFPPMGLERETDNTGLHERLYINSSEPSLSAEEAQSLAQLSEQIIKS